MIKLSDSGLVIAGKKSRGGVARRALRVVNGVFVNWRSRPKRSKRPPDVGSLNAHLMRDIGYDPDWYASAEPKDAREKAFKRWAWAIVLGSRGH